MVHRISLHFGLAKGDPALLGLGSRKPEDRLAVLCERAPIYGASPCL